MTIADLNSEARALVDADTTSYTAADLLRRVNSALETCVARIINADGTWQWDDTNYSDFPIGTQTLVEGQEAYSFNDKMLQIVQVEILSSGGVYTKIRPLDYSEIPDGLSAEQYFGSTTTTTKKGFPEWYDKQGDTIRLFPAPAAASVTLAAGIRIRYKRTASIFTSAEVTTGTKVPGIASPYHQLLAYMAALPYAISFKKDRVALFERR